METIDGRDLLTKIDWRWALVAFCYLVLFHLLPSFVLLPSGTSFPFLFAFGYVVWLAVGVVGVSVYVGWRSAHTLFLEPALASMLYTFLLMVVYHRPGSVPYLYNTYTYPIVLLVGAFVLGFTPASTISLFRIKKQKASPAT